MAAAQGQSKTTLQEAYSSLREVMGPRLKRVLESFENTTFRGPPSESPVSMYHAAVADARDFRAQKQYQAASQSYDFALKLAKNKMQVELDVLVEVMHEYADTEFQLKNYSKSGMLAAECIDNKPDFSRGYMMLGQSLITGGEEQTGVCSLLEGMEKCQLNNDEWQYFICLASQVLAAMKHRINHDMAGDLSPATLARIMQAQPTLPSSEELWRRIVKQLLQRKSLLAVTFLVCGLPASPRERDFRLSSLEFGCDCYDFSGFDVEQIYKALKPEELESWGAMLINTLVDFEAGISERSRDPEGVRIVRLALRYKSSALLEHRLEEVGDCDLIDVDMPGSDGDTALHLIAKSTPFTGFHRDLMELLLRHGALPNVKDKQGRMPHEYIKRSTPLWHRFQAALENPEEGFKERVQKLKKQGNEAHRQKLHADAVEEYEKAVALIEQSPYKMARDVAILYSNMATVYANLNDEEKSCAMAQKSIQHDPQYHKPYWRLGKSLVERNRWVEACNNFLLGAGCPEADSEQKATFLTEICTLFSSLTEKQIEALMTGMHQYLSACWPKVAEALTKNASWDAMRRLVLGPPEVLVDKSQVDHRWRFADRFTDGKQLKVGYAMCLKANTPVLSTLVEVVEQRKVAGVYTWATDLVLALLLQGAQLRTLATGDEETCYHVAVNLCCLTEKLGLLRYILSDDTTVEEARLAVNRDRRTLLHTVCLHFGDGGHAVGRQLVQLLMEKGFDPTVQDIFRKKPGDYLAPESPMTLMLARSPGDMKERGNAAFKKGQYREAVHCYTQAIDVLLSKVPSLADVQGMMGLEEERHELAVLFSNRAECRLKLGQVEEAFADAKDSVAWDGHWYRGHVRVGRALLRKQKPSQAIKAFSNAFNALDPSATDVQKKEVLKELMKILMTLHSEPPPRIPHLGYVSPELWAKIAYDFLCEGFSMVYLNPEENFKAAVYAYTLFSRSYKMPVTPPLVQVNLKPLCNWTFQPNTQEMICQWGLVLFFLMCGSDHTTLSFYEGDTYVHAAACFTLMEITANDHLNLIDWLPPIWRPHPHRILEWLMTRVAKPLGEENLQDTSGDTALHLMARPSLRLPPVGEHLRCSMVEILLSYGLNPRVLNRESKKALDCVSLGEPTLRSLLDRATKRAPEPPKKATPSLSSSVTSSSSAPKKPEKQQAEPKTSDAASQNGQKPGAKQPTKSAQSKPADDRGQKGGQQSKKMPETRRQDHRRPQCAVCEDHLAEVRGFFSTNEKLNVGFSLLVKVLGYSHQRDERHAQFVDQALELIVDQLSKSLTPSVPDCMLRVSQEHLQQVLLRLARRGKWRQLEVVVEKAKFSDVPRGHFAENIALLPLITDTGLRGAEAQRVQILNLLVAHGGQLKPGESREALSVALQHGEYRLAEQLIQLGANPKYLSLEEGDTPLHAALTIALDKDKGNFGLFEALLAMHEKDPDKHANLSPRAVDRVGNTLLHVAMQARYSKHSHKAVETLLAMDIPIHAKNREGKMAIDYLTNRSDRRAQYLRMAGKQPGPSRKHRVEEEEEEEEKSARKASPSPVSRENDAGDAGQNRLQQEKTETEDRRQTYPGENDQVSEEQKQEQQPRKDRRDMKVKDAVDILNSLVTRLRDLTPEEAKVARAAKGKWLELEKPSADESQYQPGSQIKRIVVGEKGTEVLEEPTVAGGDAPAQAPIDDEEEDEEEDEKVEESGELDLSAFDNLEWEVECTADVWKTLRDRRVPYDLKQRIIRRIQLLASGEWRPYLCRKVRRAPSTLNLYQAKFGRGARILWELAVAFSPRLSEDAEKRIDEEERKNEFAVRGGRVYTEIIRVWDIVLDNSKLGEAIHRIVLSHNRGEHCLIQKQLKGVKSAQFQGGLTKRYPMLFSEADVGADTRTAMEERERDRVQRLYPPASPSDMEFHILKFYCFSSALVYNVLKNIEMKIDFPFRVTDREHAVINLRSGAPILLLGRSGTGKTTCCLYRLWSRFLTYWTKSREMENAPWLPRTVQYITKDDAEEEEEEEEDPSAELFAEDEDYDDGDRHADQDASAASAPSASGSASASAAADVGEEAEGEEGEEGAASDRSCVQYDHLHQLFVTKNQVLCSEVQKNFRELCHANDMASQHVAVEETAMPHRLQNVDELKFPLFLTSRQLILMLDASLPPPHFFERNEDGSLKVTIQGWGADEEIFAFVPLEDDSDEEEEEGDYEEEEEGEGDRAAEDAGVDHRPKKKDNRREVTYEVFAHEIWPRIIKKTQVNYHPSLVWTEIMSFIKGSFGSLAQRQGYLSKDDYEKLGRKQAPNFTGSRDKVYELFRRYTDYKRQHGLYDEADLVFHIYQRLRLAGPLPWVLHEVFVDETQDFTQAELSLLIRLAHNPNDMFLTGDTAQSIMRGVSFRFSDLKTLFHYAKQSLRARGKTGMLEVPKQVYQLTHNYRSHAGILFLASAVLDLLVEFFPESFDRLEKDQGLFDGPQPVVLESGSPADLAILLSGNKRKTSHIEFGAHQVILVVSEEARNKLPEELSLGLVLTIYEAKGLEFDDVLLYNFFTDSQASKEWRVVTDYLERLSKHEVTPSTSSDGLVEIDEEVLRQTGRPRPLTFDPNQHKILNSELKHLYTAVTRARVNVWIFDEHEEKRGPMFEYFKARKLVKFVSMAEGTDEEGVAQSMFAEKSSPEEWVRRGDEIMARSLYDVAAKCYAMAGDTRKQNIALAHQRALEASHLRSQPRLMREAFLKAAIAFLECHADLPRSAAALPCRYSLVMKAGRCLQNARENYLAAQLFEKNSQPEVAGPLYLRARKWLEASHCFEQVDNFARAIRILDEQELYDQAIDCLQRYKIRKQDFEKKGLPLPKALAEHKPEAAFTVASLSYKAAMFYHRYNKRDRMLAAIERLPNKEDQIKFLQNHGYLVDAAQLLVKEDRITEAARMMLHNGEVDRALVIAQKGADSTLKAQCYWLKVQQLLANKTRTKKTASAQKGEGDVKGEAQNATEADNQTGARPKTTSQKPSKGKHAEEDSQSSDEGGDVETDDQRQQQLLELLEKARQQFDVSKDQSGVGECLLVLSTLKVSQELLLSAFTCFENAQPVSNVAGILECVEVLHKITAMESMNYKTCRQLIYGVEKVFDAVRVLMKPTSAEDKNCYREYLRFYGLEKAGDTMLALHPKLKPRCIRMIGAKHLFENKEEKKKERLEKPAEMVCDRLSRFLIDRTKAWCEAATHYLISHLPEAIQCRSFQEGEECEDAQVCPYQHASYTERLTRIAIDVLSGQVRLHCAVQTGVDDLRKINESLMLSALSMVEQERPWNSVETLLDFLLPAGLPTYHVNTVVYFCQDLQQKKSIYQGVHRQVIRYLRFLWDNPGRVGRGKSDNVLKERCKSSGWIVLASLLSPLLRLDVKVDNICRELEVELANKRPQWVNKRRKYALIKDGEVVIVIARRHLDALEYLQPDKFDPFESLIKFTKFVTLLTHRGEVDLMPDLPVFLFWMEVFTVIALCLAAKIKGNGSLVLPECYARMLKLVNLILPDARRGHFQLLLEQFKLDRRQNLKLLHQRVEALVEILCGSRFSLVIHLAELEKKKTTKYLLLERTLLLSLVLLLNIEYDNVPNTSEVPVLRTVNRIDLNKRPDIPERLANLIDSVQVATDYGGIVGAVTRSLGSMQEKLYVYQWRWNKWDKEALQPVSIATQQHRGPFRIFQPGAHLAGPIVAGESHTDLGTTSVDDIEEGGRVEEEEALSEEEKARYQQEILEARQEERERAAAKIITRFFRAIVIRERVRKGRVKRCCVVQQEKELFSPFIIMDTMCGICGVSFEHQQESKAPERESGENAEDAGEEAESKEAIEARLKQEHLISDEHRNMVTNFNIFREMYRTVICNPLLETGAFLSHCQVGKLRTTLYRDCHYQIDNTVHLLDGLKQMLNYTIQERRWMERDRLIQQRHMLVAFFSKYCRVVVWPRFQQYKKEQEERAAQKTAERQYQERLMEDMVEETDMAEMLDVVDRPVQHPNPQAGAGVVGGVFRGRGWGRGRGRGRGQGRGGRGERGRGRGRGKDDDLFVQFEQGDLPPRFLRNQRH